MESQIEQVSVKSDREADENSLTSDWVVVSDTQLVEELALDYNQYLNFDLSKDEAKFSESIEDMLTKLDEFCALTDMIRSDITLCLTKTLPGIQAKCQEMEAVFDKIDKLEAFIGVVRQNVAVMEEQVTRAEELHGSFGGIMKKLTSIVSPKRKRSTESSSQHRPTYQPPAIFNTGDYFKPDPTTGAQQTDTRTDSVRKLDSVSTMDSGQSVRSGDTVDSGRTVHSGQMVDSGYTVSSGDTGSNGQPVCSGQKVDSGHTVVTGDANSSGQADNVKSDVHNKALQPSSESSRDSGSGDQNIDKTEAVKDTDVAAH